MGALDGLTGDQALEILRQAMGEGGGMDQGGDEAQDADMEARILGKMKQVYEMLAQEIETLKEGFSHLEKVVMDEIIGGITNLYNENQRGMGIQELKDGLSSDFEGYDGAFSKAFPGDDLWGTLHDKLSEMGSSAPEGFNKLDKGREVINLVKQHLEGIKDALPPGAELAGKLEVATPVEPTDGGLSSGEADTIKKMVRSGRFSRG